MADKYSVMLDYLKECSALNTVFFQGAQVSEGAAQITTEGANAQWRREFVDGSVEKRFDFTVSIFKAINYAPYKEGVNKENQNVAALLDVQALIDWLADKNDANEFPDFGEGFVVDSVRSLNDAPLLAWLDSQHYNPPMAKYTVTVRVEYIDATRAI